MVSSVPKARVFRNRKENKGGTSNDRELPLPGLKERSITTPPRDERARSLLLVSADITSDRSRGRRPNATISGDDTASLPANHMHRARLFAIHGAR